MTDQELDARFEGFAANLKSEMSSFKSDITTDIKAEGEITRRHIDVVAEGLRADISVIAEGHDALRADQVRLETRRLALEHRQGKLEERQADLEEG